MTVRRSAWKTALGVLLTAIMLFPAYWIVNVSLTKTNDLRASPPHWFPWDPTLEGYRAVLRDQLPNLATSLLIGLGCVVLTLLIAAPAGYAIGLLKLRGSEPLNFILLVAQMIPAVTMAMGFYVIFMRAGMLNTVWGLIIADSTVAVPFAVLLLTTFMSGIPRELLQAARIDGAGV
ncbi:MAG: carbohydrate ABC transporter permease, partial [Cellulomonas sp.]|nr:carbohydrate ABC transporter permease [Cellulomonas sp.]